MTMPHPTFRRSASSLVASSLVASSLVASSLVAGLLVAGCQSEATPTKIVTGVDGPAAESRPATTPATGQQPTAAPAAAADTEALDPAIFTPQRARGGQLRFADERLHDNPAAAAELLRRLDAEPRTEVRVALVEALPRTGGPWLDAILARLSQESEPAVRKAMVAILPRAEPQAAIAGILQGLGDADGYVRTEAALVAGSIPAALAATEGLITPLQNALTDDHAPTRAAAARSLGILGAASAFAAVVPLLGDADPTVRLEAVRGLGRIDATRAAGLATVRSLRHDSDPKVARAAAAVVGQGSP
jgi:hypothetical protein